MIPDPFVLSVRRTTRIILAALTCVSLVAALGTGAVWLRSIWGQSKGSGVFDVTRGVETMTPDPFDFPRPL